MSPAHVAALGQYPTPQWVAELIVEHWYGDLGRSDLVLEPSCHVGHFLTAVPGHVRAIGVELDPELARDAQRITGRPVITGDFRHVEIPETPTLILGNPPFQSRLIGEFLARARSLLPEDGRLGFVLPAFLFQTSTSALRITDGWRVEVDLLPRDIYPRLRLPLVFARMRKTSGRVLVGFAFYAQAAAIRGLSADARGALASRGGSAWHALARAALQALGGRAVLQDVYAWAEGRRPTANRFWREKLRQALQKIAVRVGRGEWALPRQQILAL